MKLFLVIILFILSSLQVNAYNSTDLSILGLGMGTKLGEVNFPTLYDLDNDGEITSTDLSILGMNLGREHYFIEITASITWDTPWGYRDYNEAVPLLLEVIW